MNANTQQQEQLQEKNEASTYQMEQQMRQSPGSVTQQQIDNKVPSCIFYIDVSVALAVWIPTCFLNWWVMPLPRGKPVVCSGIDEIATKMILPDTCLISHVP